VNFREDGEYRKRLAKGFLDEARHNFQHELWRSCVDNSQLSIENSCKMVIALLEPVEKTHNPSRQIRRLTQAGRLGKEFGAEVDELIGGVRKQGAPQARFMKSAAADFI
jgi:HEPN domain-containing protein